MEDNRSLRQRVEDFERKMKEQAEVGFLTPEGSSKEAETTKRQDPERPQEAAEDQGKEAEIPPGHQQEEQGAQEDFDLWGPPRPPEPSTTGAEPSGSNNFAEKSMEFMVLMMESMKEMQKRFQEGKEEGGSVRGVEIVRNGGPDLPQLASWHPLQGPLQLGDWLLLVGPIVADLSTSSEEWWGKVVKPAEDWYKTHMAMNPLDRAKHSVEPPAHLQEGRWQRLERRVSAMLVQAVPETVREELVSSRRLGVYSILTYLLQLYCPGGVMEKQTLLKNLEDPTEITSITEAPLAIRRWLRWRRRTQEIGAVAPDPSIMLKGLNRMTKKILESNKELQFRVSLARSSLGIDTTPNETNLEHFVNHLLAEVEQLALTEKRVGPAAQKDLPKLKALDGEKGKGKGKEKGSEEERPKMKCKFFNTDQGCRKGKECTFLHEIQDPGKKRCWACGSVDHFANACPRSKGDGSPGRPKIARAEGGEDKSPKSKDEGTGSQEEQSTMKGLLEEATKMLKSMSSAGGSSKESVASKEDARSEAVERLQEQLNALKLKTFKIRRLASGGCQGLLDSGATHALRPRKIGEAMERYKKVEVVLADGGLSTLHMSRGGVMVSDRADIEPIVPMGLLTSRLGCQIWWTDQNLVVRRPDRGDLPTTTKEGCPQIPRQLALDLIEELERKEEGYDKEKDDFEREHSWMTRLVEEHPVLKDLPEHIKSQLAVKPGNWNGVPVNRRLRKRMKRDGAIVHLFAGEDTGFTLQRAFTQAGGPEGKMLEVDLKRGGDHDLLKAEGIYASLLRMALEGKILALIGGPNCRTRSVLRHYEIPGNPEAPRPVRRWGGEEFGIEGLSKLEEEMVTEDDILLWRMIFLQIVNQFVAKAHGKKAPHFSMEQPASPRAYKPEVVSWWDTEEWSKLKKLHGWEEWTFEQGRLGGKAVKPTTFGGSLRIETEGYEVKGRGFAKVSNSKDLSRWAPGLMMAVAKALIEQVINRTCKLQVLSWKEHLAFNHTPYRRDCRICQESLQQASPHRRVRNPMGGVLSIDVAGPLKGAYDQGGGMARYFLAGALTWRVPKGSERLKPGPYDELEEDAPEIEADRGGEDEAEDEAPGPGLEAMEGMEREELEDHQREEGQEEAPPDIEQETELRVFRMGLPMITKTSREVTRTAMEFVMRLRADGYHIGHIHCDRGHEFQGEFKKWANLRGIRVTRTPGDDPRGNGRVELTIKVLKNQIRKALGQAGVDYKWWPWALRCCNEVNRAVRLDTTPSWPRFLKEVKVKKRTWRRHDLGPGVEKVKYLCPSAEDHGHWIVADDQAPRVTKCILRSTVEPEENEVWLALERDMNDAWTVRRRLREKVAVRRMDASMDPTGEEESEEKRFKESIMKVIEEEAQRVLEDDPEVAQEGVKIIGKLRRMAEGVPVEEEEVLQTKIVSPKEVTQNWEKWSEAVQAEIHSLIEEKGALKMLTPEQVEVLKKEAGLTGREVEVIPSKMVYTLKAAPAGGKRKARWVICGNYEEKRADEENYSSGADATALRVLLWYSSKHQWEGCVLDVKTAFLNAEMVLKDTEPVILVKPPSVMLEKKLFERGALFQPFRAVYGLRRSPRLWGNHRDRTMREMKVKIQREGKAVVVVLVQLLSEENLWKGVAIEGENLEEDEEWEERPIEALVMTYVDDIFISGPQDIVAALQKGFQEAWKTSDPEWVSRKPVKFLGMEVTKERSEETGREEWFITQEGYTRDLVGRQEEEVKEKKIPITRDQAMMEADQGNPTAEGIRKCQKIVGEVLWLVTRTRPDIMFAVSRMGSNVTKATSAVIETAKQVWGYLKKTSGEGLKFEEEEQEEVIINVSSDASFAPDAEESHGSYVVSINRSPMFWRSGRQSTITLSTAESELNELIEAMNAGESVAVIVSEIVPKIQKIAWTDSQSALSILASEGGSWRTRHLRLRCGYARQAVLSGAWGALHCPGEVMVADLGTKALSAQRLESLKSILGMAQKEKKEEKGKEEEKSEEKKEKNPKPHLEEASKVLKLITAMAMISVAKGHEEEEEDEIEGKKELAMIMFAYTVVVVSITWMVSSWWKGGVRSREGSEGSADSQTRSLPTEEDQELQGERASGEPLLVRLPCDGVSAQRKKQGASIRDETSSGLSREQKEGRQKGGKKGEGNRDRLQGERASGESLLVRLPCDGRGEASSSKDTPIRGERALGQGNPVRLPRESDFQDTREVNLEEEWKEIEREERWIRRELNTPGSYLWTEEKEEVVKEVERASGSAGQDSSSSAGYAPLPTEGMKVYFTSFGKVFHLNQKCTHLHAPGVGAIKEASLCTKCQEKESEPLGPFGVKAGIFLSRGHRIFHTQVGCRGRKFAESISVCKTCYQKTT